MSDSIFFKDTPLGPLPEEWEIVKAGELFKQLDNRVKHTDGDIPVLSITRYQGLILQSEKFGKRIASRDTSNYKVVKQGDLVYGFPITEGVIAILHRYPIGAVSPAYHVWEITREVDLTYLDIVLKTPAMIAHYAKHSSNVVQRRRNLSPKDFLEVPIPLPPLSEQRAIAYILSTVRQSIEASERVIAATRELKRSMMKHLFTYGAVPVDQAERVRLKETEVGEIPEGGEVVRLGDVVEKAEYGINDRADLSGETPVLRMNNLVNGKVDTTNLKYVTLPSKELERYRLAKGDVLFNRTNSLELVGKTAIFNIEGDYVFASYLVRVKTQRSKLFAPYLNFYLNWEITQARLRGMATRGVSQSNISAGKLRTFQIPLPTLQEQEDIARQLMAIDAKLHAEKQRKAALEALFQSLLTQLMTGKVRVSTLIPGPSPFQGEGSAPSPLWGEGWGEG